MEGGAVAGLRVGSAEEVAAGADLAHRIEAERVLVDDDRVEERGHHLQQLGVDDHLLEAGVEATLHPAGAVHQEVDAAHDRAPQREHRFVGSLGVDGVGGADVRRSVGESVAPGELAADHGGAHVLGRAERRRPGLHVDVGREAAVHHRRARPHDLGQHHAGERFGVLLRERAGQRDRRHRTGERERRHHDDLVAGGELHDPVQHRGVEAQRRAGVDHREDRRLALERLVVDASGDPGHLEAVTVALPAEAVGVERLVRQRERVVGRVEVAHGRVDVDRLDRIAGEEVDGVEHLGQPQQILVVGPVADSPAALEIGHVRRARHRPEREVVAADHEVVVGVAGVQGERRRRGGDQRRDHVGVESDPLAPRLDVGAGVG